MNLNNIEEINEYQYQQLLFNLGMLSYKHEKKDNIENIKEKDDNNISEINQSEDINPELLLENSLKTEENRIFKNSFYILKIDKDKDTIKIEDIRNFLIFVLNIQNYELYHQFKSRYTPEELKALFPLDKYKKEDIPELMLKKQNEDLLSQVDKTNPKNTKYYYVSKNNSIIITLDQVPIIKRDFNILSLNYRNNKKQSNSEEKVNAYYKKVYPFKPKINENSEKIYQKNKDKLYMGSNETYTTNSQYKNPKMQYIDRILLLEKKRIQENQKMKEELEKNKIKECTFKPKINQVKKQKNDNNKQDKNNTKKINRFEVLYEEGKQKIQLKRDRSKEEIEIEEQKNECTFQPDIYSLTQQKIPETRFTNDIYNEKEYKYLYERLKHGRLERMVKESNKERYGLNNELKQFFKDNKEFNYLQNQAYFDPNEP